MPAGKICGEKPVVQMQSQTTFLDGLWPVLTGLAVATVGVFGLFSLAEMWESGDPKISDDEVAAFTGTGLLVALGATLASLIYTPKTAKVWCGTKTNLSVSGNKSKEVI